ncbi:uncharacterized protein LOC117180496 [Belonocnema kinseyi]|uniref:uncharacterized protein LOC117180496 n=1 Tax=Belonocnema kinseyi TaxID=2817044 RepID=UPI00143D6E6C|nr:uncharacterized protein LOC117180496 [Belonocnema kinseyi]
MHSFYFNGELPTINNVLTAVNDDDNLPNMSRSSLYRVLRELKFVKFKRQAHKIFTEKGGLIFWRRKYHELIRKYRRENRTIYYLDETWLNVDDVCSPPTVSANESIEIVLHISSEAGFVPGGLLFFKLTDNSYDKRNRNVMNGETFRFEKILPLLSDNCVIVMDNARYHSVKEEKLAKASWIKDEIRNWLSQKGLAYEDSMLKVELIQIVKMVKHYYDKFVIDEIAKQSDKIILRLPPYHCDLNPIEMAWSLIKECVKTHSTTSKLPDVEKLLHEGIDHATPEHWKNFVRHVVEEENKS